MPRAAGPTGGGNTPGIGLEKLAKIAEKRRTKPMQGVWKTHDNGASARKAKMAHYKFHREGVATLVRPTQR